VKVGGMNSTARAFDRLVVPPRRYCPTKPEKSPDPLQERLAGVVHESVVSMLDPRRLNALALDLGVVVRERDHNAGLLTCALVLSAIERQTDTSGRWLDAQRVYENLGGPVTGRTSFRDRVRSLEPVLRELLRRRMVELANQAETEAMRGRLKHFADLVIPDGCGFKLASVLSGVFPGTGNPAELKLHAVYSVKQAMASVTQSAGRVHDNDEFWPEWQKDVLYIWDLGFNDMTRFIDAVKAGSQVLQRLKSKANPVVTAWYDADGTPHALAHEDGTPMCLDDACQFMVPSSGSLDFDVLITDAQGRTAVARIVCVPFNGEDRYYLTTLPREIFTPSDCAELYRVRWEVELFFRNWHGALRMDDVHRLRHPMSLQVAILSSLLAACLGRDIHAGLERLSLEADTEQDAPPTGAFPPRAASRVRADQLGSPLGQQRAKHP